MRFLAMIAALALGARAKPMFKIELVRCLHRDFRACGMMKRLFSFVLASSIVASVQFAHAQSASSPTSSPHTPTAPVEFDSFIVVLLVHPPNAPDLPKEKLDQLQEAHIANIRRLHDEGKLLKAGPFDDYSGRNVRGMFILRTESVDQAREWVATDPAVKIGRLVPEYFKWHVEKGTLK